jgi:benzylsuccinate CoA-transferase BbsF subunit
MLSMPGFGATGPYASWLSLGPVLEAASGLAGATGYRDGGPLKLGIAFPDAVGGLTAAAAILAALWEREETGQGRFIDLSQHESYAAVGGDLILAASLLGHDPERPGNRSAAHAPQGVYRCAGEDEWVAITIRSDAEWLRFRELTGSPGLQGARFETLPGRYQCHDQIDAMIGEWTASRSRWAVVEKLNSLGIAAAPALTNEDLVRDPHLAARGFLVDIDQPEVGVRCFPGFPVHFSETPVAEFKGTSPLGGDNVPVLKELLDMPEEEICALQDAGVVRTGPLS